MAQCRRVGEGASLYRFIRTNVSIFISFSLSNWQAFLSIQFQTFKQALIDGGLELTEPEEVVAPYMPGIDYDDEEKVDELITRQTKVWALGKKSLLTRWKNLRKSNVKRRPLALPRDTAMPSYTYHS